MTVVHCDRFKMCKATRGSWTREWNRHRLHFFMLRLLDERGNNLKERLGTEETRLELVETLIDFVG